LAGKDKLRDMSILDDPTRLQVVAEAIMKYTAKDLIAAPTEQELPMPLDKSNTVHTYHKFIREW
jgi:hypothetical protein